MKKPSIYEMTFIFNATIILIIVLFKLLTNIQDNFYINSIEQFSYITIYIVCICLLIKFIFNTKKYYYNFLEKIKK